MIPIGKVNIGTRFEAKLKKNSTAELKLGK